MKTKARDILILLTGLVLGISLAVERTVLAEQQDDAALPLPLEELRAFSQIYNEIKKKYVEEVDSKELLNNAIKGMVSRLDPHSAYLLPEAHDELQVSTKGEFGGLGIEVGMEDGFVKVISPIDDTPAQRAGMKAGDLIIRIDGTAVQGLTLNEAVKKMRGKVGTKIVLTVVRKGEDQALTIDIIRDVIRIRSVKSKMLEEGFGYIRISQFQVNTGENMQAMIDELIEEDNDGKALNGMVLDLRNNPGGVLSAAVSVSDAFLTDGLVVYTDGRVGDASVKFQADADDILDGAPLVVLVNNGSASASEIVSGALQDHKRAVIMGSRTFGKGSVQTILPMRNGAALKLTTARYFTPSGRSIQAEGITPDIELTDLKIEKKEDKAKKHRVSEKDLSGHLSNGNGEKGEKADDKSADSDSDTKESDTDQDKEEEKVNLAEKDFMLFQALNMLKGLHLVQAAQ
ncbi:MAG: S41 family peptidase [Gammaproteobacteria bacterium]|jgi:carboxyl-terminal processing protease|nr:S41 family peptidase [Gammaproteobacteria bacterium]MBT4812312.1 S41 family peptidase [Thiotrichales bacterium]MBT3473741.1 S41 family peptidase [Gammaproteobacteria bacterium]MBT3968435.1 S41 family peptidase [Gammaproteobacteria bacterium]MBT4080921.1 S41 family peptidase [Gammaproteobacteria bacterium]